MGCLLYTSISELKSANNQLQIDIDKKTQIDEMRKEFLSNVSHELKTPLALIQGYAEGLKECINDDAESRDFYCEVIMDEADKMNKMVKKLLTLNQLEFGNEVITMAVSYTHLQGCMRVDGNKKGLFTRERRPKMAAHYFKERWGEIPNFEYKG